MKNLSVKIYKSYEKKNSSVNELRHIEAINIDKLLLLSNQSQLIDAIKHVSIDKTMLKVQSIEKIANAINDIVNSDERLLAKFFNHEKYLKSNAILNRVKAHIACDSRHSEKRFDKRNAQISAIVKL